MVPGSGTDSSSYQMLRHGEECEGEREREREPDQPSDKGPVLPSIPAILPYKPGVDRVTMEPPKQCDQIIEKVGVGRMS
ncbi:hypothetical protein KIPB_006987 [Kipferlia bialata]|uniref:Uncharacterized protein n=1 Tax=Kipferlia bialata TaxID=797122 RepID=A0A9K3CXV1_9EUKA|nr:hypothetical protein KIPB_006987 [Kipferlia bialata]|eukprot:g6987.t1